MFLSQYEQKQQRTTATGLPVSTELNYINIPEPKARNEEHAYSKATLTEYPHTNAKSMITDEDVSCKLCTYITKSNSPATRRRKLAEHLLRQHCKKEVEQ